MMPQWYSGLFYTAVEMLFALGASASSLRKMSGRAWAVCKASPSKNEQPVTFVPRAPSRFPNRLRGRNIVPKPDHIFDLERRQKILEDEIARALSRCSPDDPMVADLKSRMLHLKQEIERLCNKAIVDRRLH